MTRDEALRPLASWRGQAVVVTTMGTVRPWARLSDHPLDFASADSACTRPGRQTAAYCTTYQRSMVSMPRWMGSVVHRRGMEFQRDLFAGVQSGAAKTAGFTKRLLKFRSGHRA